MTAPLLGGTKLRQLRELRNQPLGKQDQIDFVGQIKTREKAEVAKKVGFQVLPPLK